MARPPRSPAAGDGGYAAGRTPEATNAGAAIRLTASAERYARANGLETALAAVRLGEAVATGDVVTIEATNGHHEFSVIRRQWVVAADATRLVLTLDHPARRGA